MRRSTARTVSCEAWWPARLSRWRITRYRISAMKQMLGGAEAAGGRAAV
jgi:hypothetical protein